MFAEILRLHVPKGSVIADVTFGTGAFWRDVDLKANRYELHASDLARGKQSSKAGIKADGGVDCRALRYDGDSFDCVVLDPPYLEGFYRRRNSQKGASGQLGSFREYYSSGRERSRGKLKWHDAVLEMYLLAGAEGLRVLKTGGVLVVKCQDEVSGGLQRLTHVEVISGYEQMGFYVRDLFVLVRQNNPGVSRLKTQRHARKNHSYFLVFEKRSPGRRPVLNADVDLKRFGVPP